MVLAIVAATLQAFVLTAAARVVARRLKVLDHPNLARKTHGEPTPLLGGVAVLAALLLTLGEVAWLRSGGWVVVEAGDWNRPLIASAVLFCILGLWDDHSAIRPRQKLLLQLVAALPYVLWGHTLTHIDVVGLQVSLGAWGALITLFWITFCVNSLNLLDGLDGVAGSVGTVVSLTIAMLALMLGQTGVPLVALILAGALVGFLMHNWPPAKIFLGDAGSLTIGFLLGALAIEGTLKRATGVTLAAPLVLMAVPAFDTVMAVLRRVLSGRGIGEGDRAHLHHRLKECGLSGVEILLAIATMCSAMGAAVILAEVQENQWIAWSACGMLVAILVVGRVFGHHETMLLLQHMKFLMTFPRHAPHAIRLSQLRRQFRETSPAAIGPLWQQLVELVAEQGGDGLELFRINLTTGQQTPLRSWRRAATTDRDSPAICELTYRRAPQEQQCFGLRLTGQPTAALHRHAVESLVALLEAFCRGREHLLQPAPPFSPAMKRAA